MTTSAENPLDWTLEDGKWKDSFDKLLDARTDLRKLNVLKKKVRASFNIDSSIENSLDNNCQVKKHKRVKNTKKKIISTPIGKLPKQPFKCSISPITIWRQELFKTNKPKIKDPQHQKRKLQSTVINPSLVAIDYDSLKEKTQVQDPKKNDSLEILLTQPHKVGTLRRKHSRITFEKDLLKNRNQNAKREAKNLQNKSKKLQSAQLQATKKVSKGKGTENLSNALNVTNEIVLTRECSNNSNSLKNASKITSATNKDALIESNATKDHNCDIRTGETLENGFKRNSPNNETEVAIFTKPRVLRNTIAKGQAFVCTNEANNLTTQNQFKSIAENIQRKSKRISHRSKVSLDPAKYINVDLSSSNNFYQEAQNTQSLENKISFVQEIPLCEKSVEKRHKHIPKDALTLDVEVSLTSQKSCNPSSTLARKRNSKSFDRASKSAEDNTTEANLIISKDRESFVNNQRRSKRTIERRQSNRNSENQITESPQYVEALNDTLTNKNKNSYRRNSQYSEGNVGNVSEEASIEKLFSSKSQQNNAEIVGNKFLENTLPTENINSSIQTLNSLEEVDSTNQPTRIIVSQNENIEHEISEDSLNNIKQSGVLPRKRVKFTGLSLNKQIQQRTIRNSKNPNNDSDIILVEPNEEIRKNNNRIPSTLENINSQRYLKPSGKILQTPLYESLRPIKSFNPKPTKKLYDEPLRPIKSFNNRTNPRDLTTNTSIQPGKWRKSLNALRRSQMSYVRQSSNRNPRQLETIEDDDVSVEYIGTTNFIGTRKTIILKEDVTFTQESFINITNYKEYVLKYCDQTSLLNFNTIYSKENMKDCVKIGEGVYGEVFMKKVENDFIVCKIIPIEGSYMVNGEVQKTFEQILPEIVISKELCKLKDNALVAKNSTAGFVDIKKVSCVEGKYPEHLVKCWEAYDNEKTSENDHPKEFDDKQLFIVLELEFAGKDLETFEFYDAEQSFAALQQIIITIAVAEEALQFEHRDLHWGNVLLRETDISEFEYKICDETLTVPTKGIKATIIDYTLSRIKYNNHCFYNDLANDEELFTATGDYQFDIYRMMRNVLSSNWEKFEPKTNVFWISYLISKIVSGVKYKNTRSKSHSQYLRKMRILKKDVLEFNTASSFAKYLFNKS